MAKKSSKNAQSLIRKELLVGLVLSLGLYYLFYFVVNWTIPKADDPVVKLVFGLKWLIYPVACFWLGVLVLFLNRLITGDFSSVFDNPPKELKGHIEYVFTTLEFLLLLFFTVVLFAVYMPVKNIAIIPTICLVFTVGRLFHWAGICKSNVYAYFGRLITLLSTVAPLMYLSVRILIMNFIK